MVKLNLGCGALKIEGFVNIDMDPDCSPDIVCDVSALDKYVDDETVEEIVAYDVIEHFDRFKYREVLRHWNKKLKTGGTILIRTNDWDRIMYQYLTGKLLQSRIIIDFEKLVWHFMCEHEKPGMGHKWGFNKHSIAAALFDTGFTCQSFIPEAMLATGNYPHATQPDFTNLVIAAVK